jgi:hypothetical protein
MGFEDSPHPALGDEGAHGMRLTALAAFFLSAALVASVVTSSYGQPEQTGISFSYPYRCGEERRGICLADAFRTGLKVVLVSRQGNCAAKTAETFVDEHAGNDFEATHLTGNEHCLAGEDNKFFGIAVVGIDLSAAHVVVPRKGGSFLSKDLESKARRIASLTYQQVRGLLAVKDVADTPPYTFSVGNVVFSLFQCTDDFLNQDGLPVLVLNDKAFLLQGTCAFKSPFFFFVEEKLHVAYWATVECCGCGDSNFFVYDLSGEAPKEVYHNSDFSD